MFPKGYRVIDRAEAERRFGLADVVDEWVPYAAPAYTQPVLLYENGLHVKRDLAVASKRGETAPNVIVDGDLRVDGEADWDDDARYRFVLVTGDLHAGGVSFGERLQLVVRGDLITGGGVSARSRGEAPLDADSRLVTRDLRGRYLLMVGHIDVVVRGDLVVSDGIVGRDIDDRGSLTVTGRTAAPYVMVTDAFRATFHGPVDVERRETVDFSAPDGLDEVILPEVLDEFDDDEAADAVETALVTGRPVLRPLPGPRQAARLARIAAHPTGVTELDLAAVPQLAARALMDLPNLHRLSLAGLDLAGGRLPDGTGLDAFLDMLSSHAVLRELDLSDTGLTALPSAIGRLSRLRVLDISDNELYDLPDEFGDLAALTTLGAAKLPGPVPDVVGRLPALTNLDLSWLGRSFTSSDTAPVPFPTAVTRLSRLRALDLSLARLGSVPDDLLALTTLEELDLRSALGLTTRLPDLSRLPRLRTLRVNGSGVRTGKYPDCGLLDAVWPVSTLEELVVTHWGEMRERPERPRILRAGLELPGDAFVHMRRLRTLDLSFNGLAGLPDDVFAGTPRLRTLDLSRNNLRTLPESLYTLTELEDVSVDLQALSSPTRQRLAALARTEQDNPALDWFRVILIHLQRKAGRIADAHRMAQRILARRPAFPGLDDLAGTADGC
jgi:Leucine-rich repeat (LRR) protein